MGRGNPCESWDFERFDHRASCRSAFSRGAERKVRSALSSVQLCHGSLTLRAALRISLGCSEFGFCRGSVAWRSCPALAVCRSTHLAARC